MNNSQIALIVGAGVLALSFANKAATAGNLNLYPQSVDDFEITGGHVEMKVKIRVQNIGNTGLVLRSIAGNVFNNNFLIGNGESFTPYQIQPNSFAIIAIKFQLSWLSIVQPIIDAFDGNGFQQIVEWDCNFNIDGLPIQNKKIKFVIG